MLLIYVVSLVEEAIWGGTPGTASYVCFTSQGCLSWRITPTWATYPTQQGKVHVPEAFDELLQNVGKQSCGEFTKPFWGCRLPTMFTKGPFSDH